MFEIVGVLIAALLAALAGWRITEARRKAAQSRAEEFEDYAETRKRIDHSGDTPVDDPDKWLRDRSEGKR